jgi:sugar phosphate isomerase/epimerase
MALKLQLIKSLWGMPGDLESQLERIARTGWDGFEFDLPDEADEAQNAGLRSAVESSGLPYFTLIRTSGPDHVRSFREQVERAGRLGAALVTSSSGDDFMPLQEKLGLFGRLLRVEEELGIRVAHETHRQTALFTPWDTAAIVREFPQIKLTADYSHWCCVSESMLDRNHDDVSLCNRHVVHIHGRVGFPGGPQVNDPRAPENAVYLDAHERWWDEIVARHVASNSPTISFDPEFGPPPRYMPSAPYTGEPTADLWEICCWMADRFRRRFEHASAE